MQPAADLAAATGTGQRDILSLVRIATQRPRRRFAPTAGLAIARSPTHGVRAHEMAAFCSATNRAIMTPFGPDMPNPTERLVAQFAL